MAEEEHCELDYSNCWKLSKEALCVLLTLSPVAIIILVPLSCCPDSFMIREKANKLIYLHVFLVQSVHFCSY